MVKQIFERALKEKYAIGAFNFASMEVLKAIVKASEEKNVPVLACVSEGAFKYMEQDFLLGLMEATRKTTKNVFFHLDHGKSFEWAKKAIDMGFDSVMIDGSSLPFEQNVELTKKVVDYAHEKGVFVEGEIGVLAGVEDEVSAEKHIYTDPQEAYKFATLTGVDSLAIAIGTSHGAYKFSGEAKLNFEVLRQIESLLPNLPLVLHGASSVYEDMVELFNEYGGALSGAKGMPDELLHKVCTTSNVCKINTDTDLRIAFLAGLRKSLNDFPSEIDTRKHFTNAMELTSQIVKRKIDVFGTKN